MSAFLRFIRVYGGRNVEPVSGDPASLGLGYCGVLAHVSPNQHSATATTE